jgi:ABC-2 type transport system permease protein
MADKMEILQHLKIHAEYLKINIKTAMEYRINFIVQTTSMILNDIVWILFWMIIFHRFNNIRGWDFNTMILLYAVLLTAYGAAGVLFGNRAHIPHIIAEGRLDYYLTLPKNILYHLLTSRSSWYDLGDLILGIILAAIFIPLINIPLFIVLVILSSIIMVSFMVIAGSLSFYIENSTETSTTLGNAMIALSSYPLSIYGGYTKILILFVIPAGFISGVPVELLKSFDWTWFLYMIGFAMLILTVAIISFYRGLKKYESGNMLYVRT